MRRRSYACYIAWDATHYRPHIQQTSANPLFFLQSAYFTKVRPSDLFVPWEYIETTVEKTPQIGVWQRETLGILNECCHSESL